MFNNIILNKKIALGCLVGIGIGSAAVGCHIYYKKFMQSDDTRTDTELSYDIKADVKTTSFKLKDSNRSEENTHFDTEDERYKPCTITNQAVGSVDEGEYQVCNQEHRPAINLGKVCNQEKDRQKSEPGLHTNEEATGSNKACNVENDIKIITNQQVASSRASVMPPQEKGVSPKQELVEDIKTTTNQQVASSRASVMPPQEKGVSPKQESVEDIKTTTIQQVASSRASVMPTQEKGVSPKQESVEDIKTTTNQQVASSRASVIPPQEKKMNRKQTALSQQATMETTPQTVAKRISLSANNSSGDKSSKKYSASETKYKLVDSPNVEGTGSSASKEHPQSKLSSATESANKTVSDAIKKENICAKEEIDNDQIKEELQMYQTKSNNDLSLDGARALLLYLKSDDQHLVQRLLITIANLSTFRNNQEVFRKAGAIPALTAMLKTETNPTTKCSILQALNNLAVNERNQEDMEECVQVMLNILQCNIDTVILSSLRALTNLTVQSSYHHLFYDHLGRIMTFFGSTNPYRRSQAVKVLINLSDNREVVKRLLVCQAPNDLERILDGKATELDLLTRVLRLLHNVTKICLSLKYDDLQCKSSSDSQHDHLHFVLFHSTQLWTNISQLCHHSNLDIQKLATHLGNMKKSIAFYN